MQALASPTSTQGGEMILPFVERLGSYRTRRILVKKVPEYALAGLLYGAAIGDALGRGTEGMSRLKVRQCYPQGLRRYEQSRRNYSGEGIWSDDMEQHLCLAQSLAECGGVNIKDMARRLHTWAITDGRCIGMLSFFVLRAKDYPAHPYEKARKCWLDSGKQSAPNGAVMRTPIMAVLDYENRPEKTVKAVQDACRLTHWDPRCVWSCHVISYVGNQILCGRHDVPAMCDEARILGLRHGLDPEAVTESYKWVTRALSQDLSALTLDSAEGMGYTLRTMAAGLWAVHDVHDAKEAEERLYAIVDQGGDADTNATVAGALLGCRFGVSAFPAELLALKEAERLNQTIAMLSVLFC